MNARMMSVVVVMLATMTFVGQSSHVKTKSKEVAGPVELKAQADLVRGQVLSFPLVVPGPTVSASVAAKINAALARDSDRVRSAASDCRSDFKASQGKEDASAWTRNVTATMRGPRFLAFLVTDNYYCGGPYPNDGMEMPLVYDLMTGSPVNWLKLLPPGVKGKMDSASDGSGVGLVEWLALLKLSKKQADGECKDVFDDDSDVGYSLNLNAEKGTLDVWPATFPHVIQACADTVSLEPAALRKLGVSQEIIEALESARALQGSAATSVKRQ